MDASNEESIESEIELGRFFITCVLAREFNKTFCKRYGISFGSGADMTPQEELFAKLFRGFKIKVKDLSELEIRARREELVEIIQKGKTEIYAIDDELKERLPKGPQGFKRSLNIDETTSDAINAINERTKKLSKSDKIREGLIKMGMDPAEADKIMSAGAILGRLRSKGDNSTKPTTEPFVNTPEQAELIEKAKIEEEAAELIEPTKQDFRPFNPFEKKE